MSNNTYPVLCGGTFFTMILEARIPRTSKRSQYAGELDGLSQKETLAGLGRVVYPEYDPPRNKRTFSTNASDYRSCDNNGTNLSFLFDQMVKVFDNRVKTDYPSALKAMINFVGSFLEVGTSTAKEVWLLKALLELIDADRSIDDAQVFYIADSGQGITKATLRSMNDFCLQSFLLGVWHFVIVNRQDNRVGKTTFDLLCPPKGRAERKYEGKLGNSITRAINVTQIEAVGDAAQETLTATGKDEQSAAHAEAQSTTGTEKQLEPKSLLDLFEDAIDKYNIAVFVDSDFTAMPLYFDDVVAVDEFIEVLRGTLRFFRRKQDLTFRYVISFINTLGHYQAFLSERMICDDGETIHWLRNIDWSEVHEVTLSLRRELNKLYGLISGGGSLSVFGYTEPNDDESESGESNESSGASTDTNSQIVNNSNAVMKQNTLQIENHEISREYYNLFVISDEIKNNRFTIPKDRSLRSSVANDKKFAELTPEAIEQIKTFPSLFMYENTEFGGRTSPDQKAYFGFVTDLRVQENGIIKVRFHRDAEINQQQINGIAHLLDIHEGSGIMELNHTHWTIKHVDLIEELTEAELLTQ